jgi:hypothetical protein
MFRDPASMNCTATSYLPYLLYLADGQLSSRAKYYRYLVTANNRNKIRHPTYGINYLNRNLTSF